MTPRRRRAVQTLVGAVSRLVTGVLAALGLGALFLEGLAGAPLLVGVLVLIAGAWAILHALVILHENHQDTRGNQ